MLHTHETPLPHAHRLDPHLIPVQLHNQDLAGVRVREARYLRRARVPDASRPPHRRDRVPVSQPEERELGALGWVLRFTNALTTGNAFADTVSTVSHAYMASAYSAKLARDVAHGKLSHAQAGRWITREPAVSCPPLRRQNWTISESRRGMPARTRRNRAQDGSRWKVELGGCCPAVHGRRVAEGDWDVAVRARFNHSIR